MKLLKNFNIKIVFFCCHRHFFWYNAKLKFTHLGGYGHRFEDKVLALFEDSH